jgi:hypothetical protein
MNSNQLASFIKQEREALGDLKIFRSPRKGPIPDAVLDNLLSEAEAILEQELAQCCPDQALGGIRLGYQIEQPDHSVESYWVGFGQDSSYEKLIKFTELPMDQEADEKDSASIPSATGGLTDEIINRLTDHIEDVIRSQLPADINNKHIHGWIFAHTVAFLPSINILNRSSFFRLIFSPTPSVVRTFKVQGTPGCCCNHPCKCRRDLQGNCTGSQCC